jgi:hypothetical protein
MSNKLDLERFTDADLHDELVRRLKAQPEPEVPQPDGLSELPRGAWSGQSETPHDDPAEAQYEDLTEIAKLARARAREILSIPIDSSADNAAATVRNINVAVSTVLTLASKLRRPRPDTLPKLLALIEAEETRLKAAKRPELLKDLAGLNDAELEEVIAERRVILNSRIQASTNYGLDKSGQG